MISKFLATIVLLFSMSGIYPPPTNIDIETVREGVVEISWVQHSDADIVYVYDKSLNCSAIAPAEPNQAGQAHRMTYPSPMDDPSACFIKSGDVLNIVEIKTAGNDRITYGIYPETVPYRLHLPTIVR